MVFNDFDRSATSTLCTLAKIIGHSEENEQALVTVGQELGLSKDDVSIVLNEWDELDVIELKNEKDKEKFVSNCFSFVDRYGQDGSKEIQIYHKVVRSLGLNPRSLN